MSARRGTPPRRRAAPRAPRWTLHVAVLALTLGVVGSAAFPAAEPAPAAGDASSAVHDQLPLSIAMEDQARPVAPMMTSPLTPATAVAAPTATACTPSDEPLPAEDDPAAAEFWRAFEAPLPPEPMWDPPGPKRVGIQAGHWLRYEVPWELHHLDFGSSGGGRQEWEVALDLAKRTQSQLEAAGVQVDLLPVTVPERYRAHAFVAIHADASAHPSWRGFKVARPVFSAIPDVDDQLVAALETAYAETTGFPRDADHISSSMREYYAFNSRRYCHAVAPGVPQSIIETGYLTSAEDRAVLFDDPDTAARGITRGILRFLARTDAERQSAGGAHSETLVSP